jgi:hypothetical protein
MSRKQQARDALRAAWPELLSDSLEEALADAQNSGSGKVVLDQCVVVHRVILTVALDWPCTAGRWSFYP